MWLLGVTRCYIFPFPLMTNSKHSYIPSNPQHSKVSVFLKNEVHLLSLHYVRPLNPPAFSHLSSLHSPLFLLDYWPQLLPISSKPSPVSPTFVNQVQFGFRISGLVALTTRTHLPTHMHTITHPHSVVGSIVANYSPEVQTTSLHLTPRLLTTQENR